ncbi:hypothetical protein EJ08DRAFT_388323 [Tothia fuscella]|uniref:Uncharacterized protein n=1 Tax=Tothia fuscella TaxID=1048955 RepID=A0A9P4U1U7_9PEZI|nr:hypothetical protein EJ08DRAFT_388323 [Tothia fuscella]
MAELQETDSPSTLGFRGQLIDTERFENCFRRAKISTKDAVSMRDASTVPQAVSQPAISRIPEDLFYNNNILIQSSFKRGHWKATGDEALIDSSDSERQERHALHTFLGKLVTGCKAAASGDSLLAGSDWNHAFEQIEILVKGQYHDIIPNLIQKVNDLQEQGYHFLALELVNYVAQSCVTHQVAKDQDPTILLEMRKIDMVDMIEIEEQIMAMFVELFARFLGPMYYNSFVMRMNAASRKLIRDNWARLDDHIPALAIMDNMFGPTNRRSLDIIRLRVEVLHHRQEYESVEVEAELLISRASLLENDDWLQFYFLIKGYYFSAYACYRLKRSSTLEQIYRTLRYIELFSEIDSAGIFEPKQVAMLAIVSEMTAPEALPTLASARL